MSLYREPGQTRRRRRLFAAGGAVTVLVIAIVVILLAAGGAPSRAERVKDARAAAGQALDGLELVEIEYRQAVRNGRIVAPTEYDAARADVQRARDALARQRADLRAVDPGALTQAQRALDRVGATVERRAGATALRDAVRQARAAIEPLAR